MRQLINLVPMILIAAVWFGGKWLLAKMFDRFSK
jgi:hypothetical protein